MSVVPQLVYSRDARRWTRVDRASPFIRPRQRLAWDDGCIIPFTPQAVGDDVFIFYYGKNAGHIWGAPTTDGTSEHLPVPPGPNKLKDGPCPRC